APRSTARWKLAPVRLAPARLAPARLRRLSFTPARSQPGQSLLVPARKAARSAPCAPAGEPDAAKPARTTRLAANRRPRIARSLNCRGSPDHTRGIAAHAHGLYTFECAAATQVAARDAGVHEHGIHRSRRGAAGAGASRARIAAACPSRRGDAGS